jgi:zinc transport system substrate-binding protein
MKKIITLLFLSTSYIFSHINTVVSITPVMTFVKAIGGDKVNVSLMVQAGDSPHTYEPKPSQMTAIAKAQLYFAIGVEFEDVWLPKFHTLNTQMKIVDLTQNIKKIEMLHHEKHTSHTVYKHENKDPHVWTSPANVKIIAQNIYKSLSAIDKPNTKYYEENLNTFLSQINTVDIQLQKILSSIKGSRNFMVFHPSWGYFAKEYQLRQIAVEVEGKNPKPKELVHLIKEAKKEKVTAIITQPEFSDSSAKIIAHELHIPVVKITPLAPNWSANLIQMAHAIAGQP